MKRSLWNGLWIVLIFTRLLVDAELSASSGGISRIIRENHFPEFKDCSSYKPRIKEEQPAGTPVITVKATDPDPLEEGGTITYQLIADSQQSLFSIDPSTGQIITRVKFNRDEPARQQEEKFIVRATDDGRPQLEAICLITVTIEDINDNAPAFEKSSYKESIPLDLKVNSEVLRVSATDIDDGLNREVEYGLSGIGEDYDFFAIDKTSGIVKLMKEITKPVDHVFKIQVSATDKNPTAPKSSRVELEIKVIEANSRPPKFDTPLPEPVIELFENFMNVTESIATFKAKLEPEEQAPVFTLLTGNREETNSRGTFVLVSDEEKAHIRLSGDERLDYEIVKEYTLTVRMENRFQLATEHSFKIKLKDVNDNAPKFERIANSRQILENERPGTIVMTVLATDADEIPAFREITYELQDFRDEFEINSKSGVVTTKKELDREAKQTYTIKVVAKDGAPSAILSSRDRNSAEQVFRIDVADKNDNSPRFEKDKYSVEILENVTMNTVVVQVKATDPDSASQITYSIVNGNKDNSFKIDSATGVIRTNAKLEFEKTPSYRLEVQADDGLNNAKSSVEIKVINIVEKVQENKNKHAPQFWPRCQEVTIPEKKLIPGCIATVKAVDPDLKSNVDQKIVYSLLNASLSEFFKIDTNKGCLSVVKPLDRRLKQSQSARHWNKWNKWKPAKGPTQYQVLIKGSDDGGNPLTSKSSVAVVFVNVVHRCWVKKRSRWHKACANFKPCADNTFDCLLTGSNSRNDRNRKQSLSRS